MWSKFSKSWTSEKFKYLGPKSRESDITLSEDFPPLPRNLGTFCGPRVGSDLGKVAASMPSLETFIEIIRFIAAID